MAKIMEDRVEQVTTSTRLLWVAVALITISTFLFGFIAFRILGTWKNGADFGNTFAALGTYFSGLAFAGLIYTIFLQRQELKLQRQELAMTREELKGQKEELEGQRRLMETQNELLLTQRFEDNFITLNRELREVFQKTDGEGSYFLGDQIRALKGRSYFAALVSDIAYLLTANQNYLQITQAVRNQPINLKHAIEISAFWSLTNLESYANRLAILCSFLNDSQLTKNSYFERVKAQLTQEEKIVIVLYSLTDKRFVEPVQILQLEKLLTAEVFRLMQVNEIYKRGVSEGIFKDF